MIERIVIRNFAIIDKLELEFHTGMNIFTGETGAGKSIIVGALGLLLGERGDSSVIRGGTEKAVIEAEFSISNEATLRHLKSLNLDDPSTLIIRREIAMNGKSRAFVNGFQEPIAKLAEIGQWLVDIHGQHDHQLLLKQALHIDILDAYGSLYGDRDRVALLYQELLAKIQFKNELEQDEHKLMQEKVFWESAVKDIREAGLAEGEEEELREQLRRMENAEKISEALNGAYQRLYDEELSVSGRMKHVLDDIAEVSPMDPRYQELLEMLQDAAAKIDESVNLLADYKDELDFNAESVDRITDRMQLIKDLKRKFIKNSIEELNAYAAECEDKLSRFENRGQELEQLNGEIEILKKSLTESALALSRKRQEKAGALSVGIEKELAYLGMEKARFVTDIKYVRDENSILEINGKKVKVTEKGIDRVEFMISSNVGQDARPLKKVASGGEISRVMLALKSILSDKDSIETLIFDEIDTGIGGLTAGNVGEKMLTLAANKQLLVITHLPQIAGRAQTHFVVSKEAREGQTYTVVKALENEERVSEIARMLGGESETSLAHAREILGM